MRLPAANVAELQADAELGADRNAVVRLMITDRPEGSCARCHSARPASAIRRAPATSDSARASPNTSRCCRPNSHGEANPADKDPVPPPFDNTYNSPEHDAFVMKVKYQRNDSFFTANLVDGADRAPAEPGVERSLRIMAVSRCLPRHAGRPLRPDAEEPSRSRT